MEGLLNAANVSIDKFIIGELPVKSGEVSIMTLKQAYKALGGDLNDAGSITDPTKGYNTSTYYMYAVNNIFGVDDSTRSSTLTELQSVGIDWYKKLNKPATKANHWLDKEEGEGAHLLFGGPLKYVSRFGYQDCAFGWYYSESEHNRSSHSYYWSQEVSDSVYVAVVHS